MSDAPPKIILVGNYENDRQQSMLRFAEMLGSELRKLGIEVETIRPRPFFGLLKRGSTGLGKWLGYLDKFLVFPIELKRVVANAGSNTIVHICDHSNAFYTRYLQKIPHLVTCNDLLAVRSAAGEFPQNPMGWTGKKLQQWILRGLCGARRITCISTATRDDLLRFLPEKKSVCDVTLMGLNPCFTPMPKIAALEKIRALTGNAESFVLHVGGNQWYKNRIGVLEIFASLSSDIPDTKLVMVGPPHNAEMSDFFEKNPRLAAQIITCSDVDNETLRALYFCAALLLFPSLEEGFGWPIIEAQACGCRVITTGKLPMTEAGGDAAFYIAQTPRYSQPGVWAKTAAEEVRRILAQDETERTESIARGLENAARFSASEMAHRYVAIYRELLYKP